jgi:RimJ/RimL family protein N-acetyltransferase
LGAQYEAQMVPDNELKPSSREGMAYLLGLVRQNQLEFTIIERYGVPIGFLMLSDFVGDNAEIHFLCHPNQLRAVLRAGVIQAFITEQFKTLNKLKARPFAHQHTARKLITRLQFRFVGKEVDEAPFNGRLTNRLLFEMTKKYWEKRA